jgi:hypothetical protein
MAGLLDSGILENQYKIHSGLLGEPDSASGRDVYAMMNGPTKLNPSIIDKGPASLAFIISRMLTNPHYRDEMLRLQREFDSLSIERTKNRIASGEPRPQIPPRIAQKFGEPY